MGRPLLLLALVLYDHDILTAERSTVLQFSLQFQIHDFSFHQFATKINFNRSNESALPTASPDPLMVCNSSGLPLSGLRQRACMRRAWNDSKLEQDDISR